MEFLSGVKPQTTLELKELQDESRMGSRVRVNGAVHSIRDMGEVAFVVLRKRQGILQCVLEEGCPVSVKEIREGQTVEAEGTLEKDERAPYGIEVRVQSIRILSEPSRAMPLPVGKWKLNTSLEAKLNYRNASLRNIRERVKFRIQEGITRGFRDFLYGQGFTENPYS